MRATIKISKKHKFQKKCYLDQKWLFFLKKDTHTRSLVFFQITK
jgi:hypothetical protein